MENKKLIKYLLITFMIAWITWGILGILVANKILVYSSIIGSIIFTIGGFGPTIASIILLDGKKSLKNILNYIFSHKKNTIIYLLIFCTLEAISVGVSSRELNQAIPLYMIPLILIQTIIIGGGNEELGWRGLMQPTLEKKMSFPLATLITGVVWSVWHLPLWFIEGTSQSALPFVVFALFTTAMSFWLACVYKKTNSIFYCSILHGLNNLLMTIFILKVNAILIIGLLVTTILSVVLSYKDIRLKATT